MKNKENLIWASICTAVFALSAFALMHVLIFEIFKI